MDYIKPYSIFENKEEPFTNFPKSEEEVIKLCDEYKIDDYIINDDLSIDVNGDVWLAHLKKYHIPINFNIVKGYFNCYDSKLITLEGAPKEVGDYFSCGSNKLTSLEYSPIYVGNHYSCDNNELYSLKGIPNKIYGHFNCEVNNLKSLEYFPTVKHDIVLDTNPIYHIVRIFIHKDNYKELLEEFNDYSIVRGNDVILNRLKAFVSDFDLTMPYLKLVSRTYNII